MKGLFIAFEFNCYENINEKKISGIEKKIHNQFNSFIKNDYIMDFFNPYQERKRSINRIIRRLPFHFIVPWKCKYDISKYDFIYIRKPWFMDGDLIKFLKKVKRQNVEVKIIMEIPTYPYDDEGKEWNLIPLKIKDKKWRKKLKKYVNRIVTYSNDDDIFGIKTIKAVNGVDVKSISRGVYINEKYPINMIACATINRWHGYDRAIEGMKEYYNKGGVQDVKLYIVGTGSEYENYKKLISKYKLKEKVFLLGPKFNKELDEIYNQCVIGLDSMGRHRSGVFYNSSLKGKEYTAKGLMIVSGVNTEFDYDENYKYYYRIPADDSPMDIESVVKFYEECTKEKELEQIQKEIVEYARINFDFDVSMRPIIKYVEN